MHTQLQRLTEEFLQQAGFPNRAEIYPPEDGDVVTVSIYTSDAGMLIGKGGQNIYAVQHILRRVAQNVLLDPPRFVIDVNDYRKERKTFLRELADRVADRVIKDDVAIELKPMNSFERRVIHVRLADQEGVTTESTGKGKNRRVVVSPKE